MSLFVGGPAWPMDVSTWCCTQTAQCCGHSSGPASLVHLITLHRVRDVIKHVVFQTTPAITTAPTTHHTHPHPGKAQLTISTLQWRQEHAKNQQQSIVAIRRGRQESWQPDTGPEGSVRFYRVGSQTQALRALFDSTMAACHPMYWC